MKCQALVVPAKPAVLVVDHQQPMTKCVVKQGAVRRVMPCQFRRLFAVGFPLALSGAGSERFRDRNSHSSEHVHRGVGQGRPSERERAFAAGIHREEKERRCRKQIDHLEGERMSGYALKENLIFARPQRHRSRRNRRESAPCSVLGRSSRPMVRSRPSNRTTTGNSPAARPVDAMTSKRAISPRLNTRRQIMRQQPVSVAGRVRPDRAVAGDFLDRCAVPKLDAIGQIGGRDMAFFIDSNPAQVRAIVGSDRKIQGQHSKYGRRRRIDQMFQQIRRSVKELKVFQRDFASAVAVHGTKRNGRCVDGQRLAADGKSRMRGMIDGLISNSRANGRILYLPGGMLAVQ